MKKDGHWEKDKLYETAWGNDVTYDETEFYPYFQVFIFYTFLFLELFNMMFSLR